MRVPKCFCPAADASRERDFANNAIRWRNAGKKLRYAQYAANENLLISRLKNNLIMIFFEKDAARRALLFQKLIDRISRGSIPVDPGRSFPRRPDSHKRIACRSRKAL